MPTRKFIGPVIGAAGAAISIKLLADTAYNISRRRKPVSEKRRKRKKRK